VITGVDSGMGPTKRHGNLWRTVGEMVEGGYPATEALTAATSLRGRGLRPRSGDGAARAGPCCRCPRGGRRPVPGRLHAEQPPRGPGERSPGAARKQRSHQRTLTRHASRASHGRMGPRSLPSRLGRSVTRRLMRWRRVPAGRSRRYPRGGGGGRDDGGAGVREPRRPRPGPPAAGASAEPTPDQFLDLPRT
jgi:hypothetical protein